MIWVHRVSAGLNAELMTEWSGGTVEGVRTVFRGLITSVVTASLVPTASCVRRRAALGPVARSSALHGAVAGGLLVVAAAEVTVAVSSAIAAHLLSVA